MDPKWNVKFVLSICCCCCCHLVALTNAKAVFEDDDYDYHGLHKGSSKPHHVSKRDVDSKGRESPWLNTDWNALGRKRIKMSKTLLENSRNTKKAKNVILFIGDGMGLPSISAGRILKAQVNNLKAEDIYLAWEKFPYAGLARTYTVDRITADSAASATAYLSGVKANFMTLGVNDKVELGNCSNIEGNQVDSILHKSIDAGKWTGLVTTTTITHASPGSCYASTAFRIWEASVPEAEKCKDIAYQLIHSERNQDIRVMFGGGLENFLPNTTDPDVGKGLRTDNRNLLDEWLQLKKSRRQKAALLKTKTDFDLFDPRLNDYVLGLFANSHLEFEAGRDPSKEPSLAEMTQKAIELLKRSPNGFFLFVEGGRIDHGHHSNSAYNALHDVLALEAAVSAALKLTDPEETLILVTADHSHVFTLGGYGTFKESIFGFASSIQPALDGKPYTQLMYANGPGFKYHKIVTFPNGSFQEVPRKNISNSEVLSREFLQDSAVWTKFETHGGEDVAVYASGPWSQLFKGTEEQTYVAHVMMYASCVGQYQREDHCTSALALPYLHRINIMAICLLLQVLNLSTNQ